MPFSKTALHVVDAISRQPVNGHCRFAGEKFVANSAPRRPCQKASDVDKIISLTVVQDGQSDWWRVGKGQVHLDRCLLHDFAFCGSKIDRVVRAQSMREYSPLTGMNNPADFAIEFCGTLRE